MQCFTKLACILLSALMLMSALSGCGEKEEESEETRFVVRASVCGSLDSLDPALNTDADAESVFYALYENLMRSRLDEEGNAVLETGIAKDYEEVRNYDGTVDYLFTLRSTARWSDGARVKAKDFVYAWKRLANPELSSPNSGILSMVQGYDEVRATGDLSRLGIKAEGDAILRITLRAPCTYFLSDVCTAVATMPLRSDQESENPDWATGSAVLCNGPYEISAWSKDSYLQLRRNTSYHEARLVTPDVLRLNFKTSAAESWQLYEEETVDFAPTLPGRADATGYTPLLTVSCVLYNHMSEIFSNAHIRRAFDLVLDRTAIAAAVGAGMRPASGFVPYGVSGGNGEDFRTEGGEVCAVDEENYPMRCLESEDEMRLGGYWGGVGFPEISCIYPAGDELRAAATRAALIWSDKLKVNIVTEALEQEEYDRRVREGEYDVALGVISAEYADAYFFLAPFAGADANNALHYVNKPFDLLIGIAETSTDAARAAILHDAEALLLEDTALSPLYFGSEAYLLRDTLTGVRWDLRGNALFTAVSQVEPEAE